MSRARNLWNRLGHWNLLKAMTEQLNTKAQKLISVIFEWWINRKKMLDSRAVALDVLANLNIQILPSVLFQSQ